MLGGGGPVGVDRLHVLGVGLALPADHEPLGERAGPCRPRAAAPSAGRRPRAAWAAYDSTITATRPRSSRAWLVGDVVGLPHAERRRQHRDAGLHVDADVAGVHRDVVRLGGRQARARRCRRSAGPRPSRTGPGRRSPRCRRRGSAARTPPCPARRSRSRTRRRPPARGGPRSCRLLRRVAPCRGRRSSCPLRPARHQRSAGLGSGMSERPRAGPRQATAGVRRPRASTRPTSPTTRSTMFRRWFDDTVAAGLHEPNAMVVSTVSRDGPPVVADGAAQGPRRAGLRVLHQLASRKAEEIEANPAVLAAVPVARPAAPGARRGHRVAGGRSRRARPTSPAGPRESRLGAWASPQSAGGADAAPPSTSGTAACCPAVRRRGRRTLPPFWGGSRVRPRPWSSGRAAGAGCTTGCATAVTGRTGWSSGLRRDHAGADRATPRTPHLPGCRSQRRPRSPNSSANAEFAAAAVAPEHNL